MSSLDSNKPFNNNVSEKQFNGYYVPAHNAKVIKESIQNGTAPFLPDQSGNVKTSPIYNGNTGYCLNAKDLIPMQIGQGNSTNIAVTYKTINAAGTRVKEGEKGFFYNYEKDKETHAIGTSQFFFPEQTINPELVVKAVETKVKKNEYHLNKTIEILSSEPEEYLGNYVAACRSGATLKVNPEIAKAFTEKFIPLLDNQLAKSADRNENIDKLNNLMFKIDTKANEVNKELFAELKRENQPVQNQGKKKEQEMGRS